MIFFFLSSGLFLGWSLGANDAANVFGSAVGTKMVSFTRAAIIASIFVILGAVIQGAGASQTLGELGSVSAIGGAFTVALSAGITVFWMTKLKIPVSTSQAIVGAIIGWNIYTGNPTNMGVLTKILSTWIAGPILGAAFAIILYYLISFLFRISKNHLLKEDAYIRLGLLLVGAFSSFSLGANNIANVMGVFIPSAPDQNLDFGLFTLNGVQQLFLLGGIAISIGIFTYSRRVMETVGNGLFQLSSKSAIVTVLAHSAVLFVFSSSNLSNFFQSIGLPPIPLVPVSSSQVIVGAILGLGLLKGGYNIQFKLLGGIAAGWVATPFLAGIFSFFALFFVSNVFLIKVNSEQIEPETRIQSNIPAQVNVVEQTDTFNNHQQILDSLQIDSSTTILQTHEPTENILPLTPSKQDTALNKTDKEQSSRKISSYFYFALIFLIIGSSIYMIWYWLRLSIKRNQTILNKNQQILKAQKDLAEIKTKYQLLETKQMEDMLSYKNEELTTMALNLIEKNNFLEVLKEKIEEIKVDNINPQLSKKLNNLFQLILQNKNVENEREAFNLHVEEINKDFFFKLNQLFPDLSRNEKRLCVFIRLDMSSKEISTLTNISPKSVEMSRYRLRKKMNLDHSEQLNHILQKI